MDHFRKAEELLARIDTGEVAPPFIKGMTSRALVHAQLAIAQALANDYDFISGDTSNEYPHSRSFLPVRTVETRGDVL